MFGDPDIQAVFQDPDLIAKLQAASNDPVKMAALMKDPRLAKIAPKLMGLFGGGMGGGGAHGPGAGAHSAGAHAGAHSHPHQTHPKGSSGGSEADFDLD